MKRKTLKISSNTLFVYKSVKASNGKFSTDTEATTMTVTTSSLTGGIFHK